MRVLSRLCSRIEDFPTSVAAAAEAVAILRHLAAIDPVKHLPDLADSLNKQSLRLEEADRRADGLAAIGESVAIYRHLYATDPETYRGNRASALHNFSIDLEHAGYEAEAEQASSESQRL